ncbi:tail fiber domain-containing protein [Leptothoe spongobia]|uniref:Tail fiber domain-containing protein n=1 Tax=Leptothoe spongobia TAU-MAC 1115 TaxID=1967444 RepID=A0A947DDR8_9CYAN|nr:tail fiber domain-containing protein [Leptothoe spongobia]MBT9314474.1 tail fiber domain-containing protein [Leptothoe spongobia TAU-MAC 1115]
MVDTQSRENLYELFKTGAKPSEEDFKAFIDSVLNGSDDGISKPSGEDIPLKVMAQGTTQNLLDFYNDDTHTWRINQQPDSAQLGFNLSTGGDTGSSRLFVESGSGKVGFNTAQPVAQLHIQQSVAQQAVLKIDAINQQPLFGIDGSGKVGIGTAPGTEQLKVTGNAAFSGAIGIGDGANPAHKLTVNGGELALRVTNNANSQGILFQNSGYAYTWRIYRKDVGGNRASLNIASGADADYSNLSDRIVIDKDGKVGVGSAPSGNNQLTVQGSTTVSGNLSVAGTSSLANLSVTGTASFSSNLSVAGTGESTFAGSIKVSGKLKVPGAQQIIFEDGNTSNNLKLQLWDGYGLGINNSTLFYAANGKHSWRDSGGANERMLLTTAANGGLAVKGAGNSSFAGRLSVGTTDVGAARFKVANSATDFADFAFSNSGMGQLQFIGWPSGWNINAKTNGKHLYLNRDSGDKSNVLIGRNGKELFVRGSDGKVGIGTTDPGAKLHVINTQQGADGNTLILGPTNSSHLRLGYHANYSWIQSHAGKPLCINALGNKVGIGTTSPNRKLTVNGDFGLTTGTNQFRMYMDGENLYFYLQKTKHGTNKTIRWDGDTNWDAVSDMRLKTDIDNEVNILNRIMQLEVKNYRWKDNPGSKAKKIGFVAQDIQPLFPTLVGEIKDPQDNQSTLTLKYAEFGALAIGGLKELKLEKDSEITELKDKMDAEIAALKKQIQQLKS